MSLSDFPVRASIGVTDIHRAVTFYEGILGLEKAGESPSADIEGGGRTYRAGGGTMLNVFQTPNAGGAKSTVVTWYVDELDLVLGELTRAGAEIPRYDGLGQDERGVAPRAGGGRIFWIADPDGNTIAVEADEGPPRYVQVKPASPDPPAQTRCDVRSTTRLRTVSKLARTARGRRSCWTTLM